METIREIIKNHTGIKVDDDTELIKSKILTSYLFYEVICEIEERFEIAFIPEEIENFENFSSVGQIVRLLENKRSKDAVSISFQP